MQKGRRQDPTLLGGRSRSAARERKPAPQQAGGAESPLAPLSGAPAPPPAACPRVPSRISSGRVASDVPPGQGGRKASKRHPGWKGSGGLISVGDVISHGENPEESADLGTDGHIQLRRRTQNSHTQVRWFLYTKSEQSGEDTKKTVPFTRATKRIKYVEINLTKEVRDLYTEKRSGILTVC